MTINWNVYQQQALSTAIYPLKREIEYTVLGLCSEVGEVGDAYMNSPRAEILKELGDVYWYVAATANALNCPLQHIADEYAGDVDYVHGKAETILAVVAEAAAAAGVVKKAIRDNDGFLPHAGAERIKRNLGVILTHLEILCEWFSSTPGAVTAANLNKLADRKKRGVLAGSGDNR